MTVHALGWLLLLACWRAEGRQPLEHWKAPGADAPRLAEPAVAVASINPLPATVEEFPAIQRLAPKACVHCHQVWEFQHEQRRALSEWKTEEVWVYPLPQNVGLTLDPEQGNRVQAVLP